MAELLASKIIINEEEPTLRSPFPALTPGVLGIIGIAERGPVGEAILLESFADYERIFGSYILDREMPLAVRAFFLNGGQKAYAVRTCHYSGSTPTAEVAELMLQTAAGGEEGAVVTGTETGPWALAPNDTLKVKLANPPGGEQTATFTATAALIECGSGEPFDFANNDTLLVKIDGQATAQTITFVTADFSNIDTATAEEICIRINKELAGGLAYPSSTHAKVTIASDRKGLGSHVQVTGGTANVMLGFDTGEVTGTGNVQNIGAVTIGEMETILEAAWTNDTGVIVTSSDGCVQVTTTNTGSDAGIEIQASSSCETVFGFDTDPHVGSSGAAQDTLLIEAKYPGAYANSLKIKVGASTSGEASEFDLQVLKNDVVIESFPNLSMDTAVTRYAETILNHTDFGSYLIVATDEDAVGTPTVRRPVNNGSSGVIMTGGDDGLVDLATVDYIGVKVDKSGLYAFDLADEISILACPDNMTTAMQKAMLDYVRIDKSGLVFAILDPQIGLDTTGIRAQRTALGAAYLIELGGLYWPGFVIPNPSKTIYGQNTLTIVVRPSGYIAGIMARNDQYRTDGPFHQPAGVDSGKPTGVVDLETQEVRFEEKRDLIFPLRINPISYLRGYGIFVDGARTLKGTGNFPSVGERRGVSYIEKLLTVGLQWVRHKNNTPALRNEVEKQIRSLLEGWMLKGAFASNTPETAFFVDVSDALNPPSVVRAGKMVIRVGLATNAPAEFIIITVTRDTRAQDAELLAGV